jgi:hypothetical protein
VYGQGLVQRKKLESLKRITPTGGGGSGGRHFERLTLGRRMNASHIEAAIGRRRRPLRIPEFLQGPASNEGNIAANHANVAQLALRKLVQLCAGLAVLPPAGVGVDQFHGCAPFVLLFPKHHLGVSMIGI